MAVNLASGSLKRTTNLPAPKGPGFISCWAKFNTANPSSDWTLWSLDDGTGYFQISQGAVSSSAGISAWSDAASGDTSVGLFTESSIGTTPWWMCCVFGASTTTIYWAAATATTISSTTITSANVTPNGLWVSNDGFSTGNFPGTVENLVIGATALTAAQAALLRWSARPRVIPDGGWYPFNRPSGSGLTNDFSGLGRNFSVNAGSVTQATGSMPTGRRRARAIVTGAPATGFSGTGSAAAQSFAVDASGAETFTGAGSSAPQSFAADGSGIGVISGTAAAAAQSFAAAAAGLAGVIGSGTAAPSPFAATATGAETFSGSASAAAKPFSAASSAFPLLPSANGRYLVDQAGTPFPVWGEGAWDAVVKLTATEWNDYLDTRIAQGFNSVILEMTTSAIASGQVPANRNGDYPFTTKSGGGAYVGATGTADFSTPNDAYFKVARDYVDVAAAKGIFVILYIDFWGFGGSSSVGWWTDFLNAANTTGVCTAYGTYISNGHGTFLGFKTAQNVIFARGGDYGSNNGTPPSSTGETRAIAITTGMQAAGCTQLVMGDWQAPCESTDESAWTSLMQLNGCYTYEGVYPNSSAGTNLKTYQQARAGYNYTPTSASQGPPGATSAPPRLPNFLKETTYENSSFSPGTPADVRKAQWWAVLSGCTAGVVYGDDGVWQFVDGTWQTRISDAGSTDAANMFALLGSVAWWDLVPSELDGMRRLIPSSNGTQSGLPAGYVAAAQASSGTVMLAYVPPNGTGSQSLTVDMRSMAGNARARWWDPRSAAFTAITGGAYSIANTDSAHAFTSPSSANAGGSNDWVLVLDTLQPITGTGSAAASPFAVTGSGLVSGTGAAAAQSFAAAGSGAETFTATAAAAGQSFAAAGSGLAGTIGSAAADPASFAAAAVGAETFSGSSGGAASPFGATAAGLVGVIGSAAAAPSSFAALGAGAGVVVGDAAAAPQSFAASATGTETIPGTAAAGCSPFAADAAGTVAAPGTGAVSPQPFGAAGTGALTIAGTGAASPQPFDALAVAAGLVVGSAAAAASPFAGAGVGAETVAGTGAASAQPFAALGFAAGVVGGAAAAALSSFDASASGAGLVTGVATAALSPAAAAAAGGETFAGTATATVPAPGIVGAGGGDITGSAAAAVRPFTVSGSARGKVKVKAGSGGLQARGRKHMPPV